MPETATNILSSFLHRIQFHTHLAAFSTFISRRFRASTFYFVRMRFVSSFNQTIAVTIPTLATLLQLKKNDPFTTHPRTMCVAVSTAILFYAAYTTLLRFPLHRRSAMIADKCLLSLGNASITSLASVLLPDSLSSFVFALFGLLSTAELTYWLYGDLVTENDDDDEEEFKVRRMRVSMFFDNMCTAFSNITGQPQPILPGLLYEQIVFVDDKKLQETLLEDMDKISPKIYRGQLQLVPIQNEIRLRGVCNQDCKPPEHVFLKKRTSFEKK